MAVKAGYGMFTAAAGVKRAWPMAGVSWAYFWCDLTADLPATGVSEGDLAYVVQTHRLNFWDGGIWRQLRY